MNGVIVTKEWSLVTKDLATRTCMAILQHLPEKRVSNVTIHDYISHAFRHSKMALAKCLHCKNGFVKIAKFAMKNASWVTLDNKICFYRDTPIANVVIIIMTHNSLFKYRYPGEE